MALDPSGYVTSLQNNIRSRPIPWESAVRAKTIPGDTNKRIKAIDKIRRDLRHQALDRDQDAYVTIFLGNGDQPNVFQQVSKRQDFLLYLLVLFEDCIQDNEAFVTALLHHSDPFTPLKALIKQAANVEDTAPLLVSLSLTKLLSKTISDLQFRQVQTKTAIQSLYTYLSFLSKSSDPVYQDIAMQSYSLILRTSQARELFWEIRKDCLNPLIAILRSGAGSGQDTSSTDSYQDDITSARYAESGIAAGIGIQLTYRVLLVIWQLTLETSSDIAEGLQEDYDIITLYSTLLRLSPKEKLTRLILSTLHSLLISSNTLLPLVSLSPLPRLLSTLKTKSAFSLTDADLLSDLEALQSLFEEYTTTQTTFDSYAAELRSGMLRWSPPHRNEGFWNANARRVLNEDNGALLLKLKEVLERGTPASSNGNVSASATSNDSGNGNGSGSGVSSSGSKVALAVACNDVACLVKAAPDKRQALDKLGIKTLIMALMQDEDEVVRWESLRAVGEWLRYSFDNK